MHPLLAELLDLELPDGDYALFGSGPLLVRGWIREVGDLDVIARGAAWHRAVELGTVDHLDRYDVDVVEIGSLITVGNRWGIGDFSVDALIDEAETIDRVPCVALRHVVAYKRIAGRPKDRAHLDIIESHLAAGDT